MLVEPSEFKFEPFPVDEWLYAVVAQKPVDQESIFDEKKRTLVVIFRVEQDYQFNGKNIKGQTIPRFFPAGWPNAKTKKDPILFQFVEKIAPTLAVRNKNFDSDQLDGLPLEIMVEDIIKRDGTAGQKVSKWRPVGGKVTAPKEKTKVAVAAKTGGPEIDY